MKQRIRARIVSMDHGLQEYEDIEMIRVKSAHHTLLIMQNYMPLLGELDGYIEIVFDDHTIRMQNLKGFYMHKKNDFNLLIEKGDTTPIEVVEEEEHV